MKRKIFIVLILLFAGILPLESVTEFARINVKSSYPLPGTVTNKLFSAFFEFVDWKMIGPYGMTAQELQNRGFDIESCFETGVSCGWLSYNHNGIGRCSLVKDMVNLKGVYGQRIDRVQGEGPVGVQQRVMITSDSGLAFSIHVKGEILKGNFFVALLDTSDGRVIAEYELPAPDIEWKKLDIDIPKLQDVHTAILAVYFTGNGHIILDEASLIQKDHKFQLRKEFYDFYKKWKPGTIRYPGGCFADEPANNWKGSIGPLSQRSAPNLYDARSQRMDFGLDEFIAFCRDVEAEPHIVVNYKSETVQDALDMLEYCNGSSDTEWGAKRAANGHHEPYNIKYWEIGNEQWERPKEMARRFLDFYRPMKAYDPEIEIMVDCDIWGYYDFFDAVMSIVGAEADIYSWHLGLRNNPYLVDDEKGLFLSFMAGAEDLENVVVMLKQWIEDRPELKGRFKQALTEVWPIYDHDFFYHPRHCNLATGLWTAIINNICINQCESLVINQRTSNSRIIWEGIDQQTGARIFAPTPTYYAMQLYANHFGNIPLAVNTECGTFDVPDNENLWVKKDVPVLHVASTVNKDSLFIYVVNMSAEDSIDTEIVIDSLDLPVDVHFIELSSEHFLDSTNAESPFDIKPQYSTENFSGRHIFPPHSLTIMAISSEGFFGIDSIDSSGSDGIEIYVTPNPFDDVVTINFSKPLVFPAKIRLYDILGRTIFERRVASGSTLLSIDGAILAPGAYHVYLEAYDFFKSATLFKVE